MSGKAPGRLTNKPDQSRVSTGENQHELVFSALLTPHRSLSREGFFLLMAFVALTCFISGLMFMAIGAWPVMIFMGIDVLIIWAAFKFSYRAGRQYEEVEVWRHELKVRKVAPNGRSTEHVFNPFGTRFKVDRHDEIGITRMALSARDHELDIGGFLNPKDRESFAFAFANALSRAKSH